MNDLVVTPREFHLLRALVQQQIGVCLNDSKRVLLESRLRRRVRELGLTSFMSYYRHLVGPDGGSDELQHLADAITTNTTSFFREPIHFELLAREIVPAWGRSGSGRLRLWSAACSTGQEAYSLAATVRASLPRAGWFDVKVLATDVSLRALRVARAARYPLPAAAEIPSPWRGPFVRSGHGAGASLTVSDDIRSLVVFQPLNLLAPAYPFRGRLDVIFCRNALIYFDAPTKLAVVSRLLECLKPGGYLFLGLSESIVQLPPGVRAVGHSIYRTGATAPDGKVT